MFTVKSRHLGMHQTSVVGTFASIGAAEGAAAAINNKPFCPYYAWVEPPAKERQ